MKLTTNIILGLTLISSIGSISIFAEQTGTSPSPSNKKNPATVYENYPRSCPGGSVFTEVLIKRSFRDLPAEPATREFIKLLGCSVRTSFRFDEKNPSSYDEEYSFTGVAFVGKEDSIRDGDIEPCDISRSVELKGTRSIAKYTVHGDSTSFSSFAESSNERITYSGNFTYQQNIKFMIGNESYPGFVVIQK